MIRTGTRFALAATALLALACSDRSNPVSPNAPNAADVSAKPEPSPVLSVPVSGPVGGEFFGAPFSGSFSGTYSITGFVVRSGELRAIVALSGTFFDASATEVFTLEPDDLQPFQLSMSVSGSCQSLRLTFEPLELHVLGLEPDIGQVVFDVTPESGPGNVGGSPLCAIANLLDDGQDSLDLDGLQKLAKLLNQLLPVV